MNATDTGSTATILFGDEAYTYVYRALIVATLSIEAIAIVLSLLQMVAMTVPLFLRSRRKAYSTYNLYLAYLAFPDLIMAIYAVHLILTRHDSKFYPLLDEDEDGNMQIHWMFEDNRFDHNVYAMWSAANLYVSVVLIYECYLLLHDSARMRRHKPPSLRRVTQQAMIVYAIGISAFFFEWALVDMLQLQGQQVWFVMYQVVTFFIYGNFPLWLLAYLWFRIHKEGLVQSTQSMYHGRLKLLVTYFVRIVVMYIACSLTGSLCYMVYWTSPEVTRATVICYIVFVLMQGLQAIGNFVVSLTKPDTRELVVDLLTCDYWNDLQPPEPVSFCITHDPYLGLDEAIERSVNMTLVDMEDVVES